MNKDYYKTLNINRNATQAEIKKAFRALSKKHHPDKGGDENTFKEISEAYDTLSSPEKKQKYDNPNPFENMRGGGPNMDDLFNQFFNRGNQQQRHVKKGRSLNIPLVVTLEEVYLSSHKKLKYHRKVNCKVCSGYGGSHMACQTCQGSGQVKQVVGNAFFRQVRNFTCSACNGNGYRIVEHCNACHGMGQNKTSHTVDFKIPPDLMSGQIFTHRGLGDEIANGVGGDLSVEVVIQRHPHFRLEGKNLIYEPKVSILDIMLGKEIEIPYFSNTNLNTKIPQNSGINSYFTLRGKGLAGGNLIVKPQIQMPTELSNEERETLMKVSNSDSFRIEK